GDADDVDLVDVGVDHQRLLDGARIDVEAGGDDEVLYAVDEKDVAVLVDVADVAGAQPAVHEGVGGRLLVVVVAEHDLRALDLQFAALAQRHDGVGLDVDEAHVGGGQGLADGQGLRGDAQGGAADHGRGLGEAVAFGQQRL